MEGMKIGRGLCPEWRRAAAVAVLMSALGAGVAAQDNGLAGSAAAGTSSAAGSASIQSAGTGAAQSRSAASASAKLNEVKPLIRDADLVIPLSEVGANAVFYPVEVGGTRLEVLAVRAPDGSVRTAFNTCQVCYASGRGFYKQQGTVLVCQNCGNRFRMGQVGQRAGGCNPVPITADNRKTGDGTSASLPPRPASAGGRDDGKWDEGSITVPLPFLVKAKGIFANWKRSS